MITRMRLIVLVLRTLLLLDVTLWIYAVIHHRFGK